MKPFYILLSMSLILAPQVVAQEKVGIADNAQRERDATAAALVRLIRAKLNDDFYWNIRYEPQTDSILVQGKIPTLRTPDVRVGGPTNLTILGGWLYASLSLQVQPFVTPIDYARLKAENVIVDAQLTQMKANMKDIKVSNNSFSPSNAAEKRRVDDYREVKANLHLLPDYYFRDISLIARFSGDSPLSSHSMMSGGNKPEDSRGWGAEQKSAAESLMKLLTPYESMEK